MSKVKVGMLAAGERFTSMDGGHYTATGREHVGAVYVMPRDQARGETCFAACADVERGWLDEGWGRREAAARLRANP